MLFLFTTLFLVLAGISLAILLKKLSKQKLLIEDRPVSMAAQTYRPLFAPTDDDLKRAAAEEYERLAANWAEEERLNLGQKLDELEEFCTSWSRSPDRVATVELLHRASQTGKGNAYLKVCEQVLRVWREGRLTAIAADDLAQMLESHLWLLPVDERTPGITFRLKDDIADLRRAASETRDRSAKVE